MSDKVKVIGAAVLAAGLGLLWWLSSEDVRQRGDRSFRQELLQVDTTNLAEFDIAPPAQTGMPPLHFRRDANGWSVQQGAHTTHAFQRPLNTLFTVLADLRTAAVAGNDPAIVQRYALTDSLAAVFSSPQVLNGAKLRVGNASAGTGSLSLKASGPTTAVMLEGDPNVYLVPGLFADEMRLSFTGWIPKPMANGNPANWDRLTFVFPGGTSWSLERTDNGWTANGQPADTMKVGKYLRALSHYYGHSLADPADTLNAVPLYSLRVHDRTRPAPVTLDVLEIQGRLIARSSLAPPWLVMPFDPQTELPRMFRPPEAFLP
ncbi:MAG TPA: DUF4340 domain-containing protein [Flavobacteriales bacterium]|nr:DUF4340 domain-containing protein [Flavobacteriales bacterium]HRP80855.1 DUF4340 domain-containing protein [Flavobacteriales bacterium]